MNESQFGERKGNEPHLKYLKCSSGPQLLWKMAIYSYIFLYINGLNVYIDHLHDLNKLEIA